MANHYRPDGVVPPQGFIQALLLGLLTGVAVGYALGFIGAKWFSLIILWPILMGGAAGAAVAFIVKRSKIRNAVVAMALSATCGGLSYVASHHVVYQLARSQVSDDLAVSADAKKQGLTPEMADDLFDIYLKKETGSHGFVGFVKMEAKQGVSISNHGSGGVGLGEKGSWILFLIEFLLTAGLAALIPGDSAGMPFCARCQQWYQPVRQLALTPSEKGLLSDLLAKDDFDQLARLEPFTGGQQSHDRLDILDCPQCAMADSVVAVTEVSFDKKGRASERTLDRFVVTRSQATDLVKQHEQRAQQAIPVSEVTTLPADPLMK